MNINFTDATLEGRLFHEDSLYEAVKKYAESKGYSEVIKALEYMKERHSGQYRDGIKGATELIPYINHPLTMAYQAISLGIDNETILSAILLHDIVEDTGVTLSELPFSDEVKHLVDILSFSLQEGMTKSESKRIYFERISQNISAMLIKLIDRCNNVSTMAGSFSPHRLIEYIDETHSYILPMAEKLKQTSDYSYQSFLLEYQIRALTETIKHLL